MGQPSPYPNPNPNQAERLRASESARQLAEERAARLERRRCRPCRPPLALCCSALVKPYTCYVHVYTCGIEVDRRAGLLRALNTLYARHRDDSRVVHIHVEGTRVVKYRCLRRILLRTP